MAPPRLLFPRTQRAFDVVGKGYQRPFELATLRGRNMVNILSNWGSLTPKDSNLLVQRGGVLLLQVPSAALASQRHPRITRACVVSMHASVWGCVLVYAREGEREREGA